MKKLKLLSNLAVCSVVAGIVPMVVTSCKNEDLNSKNTCVYDGKQYELVDNIDPNCLCAVYNETLHIYEYMIPTKEGYPLYFKLDSNKRNTSLKSINISSWDESVTTINDLFLFGCSKMNSPISLPNSVTKIGNGFLSGCESFNSKLVLPENLKILKDTFLYQCYSFNQDIKLPQTLESIGYDSFTDCYSMTSCIDVGSLDPAVILDPSTLEEYNDFLIGMNEKDVPAIQQGVKIHGETADKFMELFPNHFELDPQHYVERYRNLIKI